MCESDQVVKLLRVRSGPDKVIHKDRTDRQGEYSFVRHPHHDMKVYTKFPGFFESSYGHSHRCRASRSTNLSINVKG
jgi:hypothetical protein